MPPANLTATPALLNLGHARVGSPVVGRIELASNRIVRLAEPRISEGLRPFIRVEGLPRGLAANDPHAIEVVLDPRLAGSYAGSITFPTVEGPSADVRIAAIAGGPWLELLPVDFGFVLLQRTSTRTLVLSNLTNEELTVRELKVQPPLFEVLGPTTLDPQSSVPLIVRFTPTDEQPSEATLDVVASNGSRSERYTATLRGAGVRSQLGAFPVVVDFGTIRVGDVRTRRARLRNLGTLTVPALPITVDAPFSASPTSSVASGHADIELELTYAPQAPGSHASLARAGAFEVTALGRAVRVPVPELVVSPLDFGTVDLAAIQRFGLRLAIENRGELDIMLLGIESPLSVDLAPQLLAAGDAAIFPVTLTSQFLEDPATSATLRTSVGPVAMPVSFTPIDAATPNLDVWPQVLNLGDRLGSRASFAIAVRNTGTAILTTTIALDRTSDPRLTLDLTPRVFHGLAPSDEVLAFVRINGLTEGQVFGRVAIRSNDPDTPLVIVPVTAGRTSNPRGGNPQFSATAASELGRVELHLVREGYALFDAPYDACYCNPSPDWGVRGSTLDDPQVMNEDARLDPVALQLRLVPPGRAFLYARRAEAAQSLIEVVVGLDGSEAYRASRLLSDFDVWPVGVIESVEDSPRFSPLSEPPFPAPPAVEPSNDDISRVDCR